MPEAVAPVTPTPKNGAATQTQQPVEPKPNAAAPADPLAAARAELAAKEEALNKQRKVFDDERRKYTQGKNGLGAKLSEYEQLKKWKSEREQRDELSRLNPIADLEERFGKDWRDKLNALAINGVPPADLIAEQMKRQDARWEERLAQRDRQAQEREEQTKAAELEESRAIVTMGATEYVAANAKDYPVFVKLGDATRVGRILAARIEAKFEATGKLQSHKEAADELEAELYGFAETAAESEKYRGRLQEKFKPATIGTSSAGQGSPGAPEATRRTLGNHLTASTSDKAPPRSDAEREKRATEAFNAARAKSRG